MGVWTLSPLKKRVAEQLQRHYEQLCSRHGVDVKSIKGYVGRGYTLAAAVKLEHAKGNHRVLLDTRR